MSNATIKSADQTASVAPDHPLAPLTPEEICAARRIIDAHGLLGDGVRFAYVALDEPHKESVLVFEPGDAIERRGRVLLLDRATGLGTDLIVSLTDHRIVTKQSIDAANEGHLPLLDEEFEDIEGFLIESTEWLAAMRRRDLDPQKVRAVPLSAGSFGHEDEIGKRVVRVLAFYQYDKADLPWAHPIDGMVAYVDLTARRVTKVVDELDLPVPTERGQWDAEPHVVGAEMVVPYADPSPVRYWQNYFDQGEYLFGRYANSLELGCDCLGEIKYFDATVADEQGRPRVLKNAICLHEEDFGVLWKHTDMFNGMAETRRSRRLVISFFLTIGNYDYGFYWYLYLDGTIQLEAKATGIVFTSAYRGADGFANEMAPGLGAPFHQHLFSARLDMAVDGNINVVEEVDAVSMPIGPDNPWGNAFRTQKTKLSRESDGMRVADNLKARVWHITNPTKRNRLGQDVGYALYPEGQPVLLADPSSSIARRAAFATKHLWVTKYDPTEHYPAGEFVNQHPGGAGLPAFAAADRSIDGEDIVVWHTFGLTHFPRPEDWPVMPVDYTGFKLKPVGFFDRNPALNAPTAPRDHCCD
jgi:primary-amine oxidase